MIWMHQTISTLKSLLTILNEDCCDNGSISLHFLPGFCYILAHTTLAHGTGTRTWPRWHMPGFCVWRMSKCYATYLLTYFKKWRTSNKYNLCWYNDACSLDRLDAPTVEVVQNIPTNSTDKTEIIIILNNNNNHYSKQIIQYNTIY